MKKPTTTTNPDIPCNPTPDPEQAEPSYTRPAGFDDLVGAVRAGTKGVPPMAKKIVDADATIFELAAKHQTIRAEIAEIDVEIQAIIERFPDLRELPSVLVLQRQLLDANGVVVRSIELKVDTVPNLYSLMTNETGIRELIGRSDADATQWYATKPASPTQVNLL